MLTCLRDQLILPWAGAVTASNDGSGGSSKPAAAAAAGSQLAGSQCDCAADSDQAQAAAVAHGLTQQQHSQAEQQQEPSSSCAAAAFSSATQAAAGSAVTAAEDGGSSSTTSTAVCGDLRAELEVEEGSRAGGKGSLQCSLGAVELAAADYQMEQLFSQVTNSIDAVECVQDALTGNSVLQSVAVQLVELGSRLCAQLPVPWLCNNIECTNLAGVCELQLVGGKAKVCGSCMTARYCSRACQAAHWELHRPVCKQMAAVAAAAPGGG